MLPDLKLLFEMKLQVSRALSLGETNCPERRVAFIDGGVFAGPELCGVVEPGGTDWIVVRADGVRELDVRLTLRTDRGVRFAMSYRGYRTASSDVLRRAAAGKPVDPSEFTYRTAHLFEAGGELAWLNQVVALGIAERAEEGPIYRVYHIT